MNNHKTQGEWNIKLTMAINFISPKDSDIRVLRIQKVMTQKLW